MTNWPAFFLRQAVEQDREIKAVLAAAPTPPAEGEVAELVRWLRRECAEAEAAGWPEHVGHLTRAADLLAQRQYLQPVAVSERWPEFSDCDDAEHVWCWSWAIGTWRLSRINQSLHSHWLPAHALPLPTHTSENVLGTTPSGSNLNG